MNTVTLEQVIQSNEVIASVLNTKVKVGTAFKLRKMMKFIESNLSLFNDTKQDIIQKYDIKTDEDNKLLIPDDKSDEIKEDFDALLFQELEFNPEISFEDLEGIELTANELDKLMWGIIND